MAAPQPDQQGVTAPAEKKSRLAGLTAESTITLALLGVGLIVGGAWWLLQLREDAAPAAAETAAESAPAPAAGETAAPVQWQAALQGKVEELQQLRRAEQERIEAERRRVIEEQQAQAAAAAEAKRRTAEQERLAAAARAAPPPATPAVATAAAPAAVKKAALLVAAKVDWKSCSQPSYPQTSIRRKEEGVVIMAFHIDAAGKVIEKRIDKSSGSLRLDQAAIDAIARCTFTPGTADGAPAASWAMMRFVWKLEG